MADKSSIFKVNIDISNIDQHRYEQLCFTVALDPSETINHMVMRLLAYAMVPEQNIEFGRGVCAGSDPDVGVRDFDEHYLYWIDAGFPTVSRVKKASHQADNVLVFSVSGSVWLEDYQNELMNLKNVHLLLLQPEMIESLGHAVSRNIQWSLVIDGNKIGISDNENYLESNITRMHSNVCHSQMTV
jgi:uncharacterized protein YaeQ